MRSHLRSNLVGYLALFVALGGTSYAAAQLPANSVKARQIKAGAVASSEVRDGSLRAADFRAGQLPAGPAGAPGPAGPAGAPGKDGADGTARAFAHVIVTPGGAFVDSGRARGLGDASFSHPGPGITCVSGLPFTPLNVVVTSDAGGGDASTRAAAAIAPDPTIAAVCGQQAQVAVITGKIAVPENVDDSYYVTLN